MADTINMWTCGFACASAFDSFVEGRYLFAAIYTAFAVSAVWNKRRDAMRAAQ